MLVFPQTWLRPRGLRIAVAIALTASLSLSADYLPKVGPAPLRFMASAKATAGQLVLPPLAMADAVSGSAAASSAATTPPPSVAEPSAAISAVENAWRALSQPDPAGIEPPQASPQAAWEGTPATSAPEGNVPPATTIAPQSLIRFFGPRSAPTNAVDAGLVLPVTIFRPPAERPPASSSATYTTR